MELKSLSQRIECARMKSWCLGMIKECLGYSSMRLGAPFIAPRQLGAIGTQQGRKFLPSVGWHTGQALYHVRCGSPSILGAADRWIFGLVGAPDIVRCPPDNPVPPADRWRGPRVARGLRGRPLRWRPLAHRTVRWTTGQSGAPPDSPMNYSHTPPTNS
jgi:hypothetical protein